MNLFNNFETVLTAMKSGGWVAFRMAWVKNGESEFSVMVQYPTKDNGLDFPHLVLCKWPDMSNGGIISGWRPGDEDLFANDWCPFKVGAI
jgi:hypothetical protein